MPAPSQVHVPSAEKDYTIVEKDGKWCLIAGDGKTLGCHPSRGEAEAQEKAVKAQKSRSARVIELTAEDMAKVCSPCAAKMLEHSVSRLKLDLSKDDFGVEGASSETLGAIREFAAEKYFDLDETHNIRGVEIFSIGEWNGDPYTSDDLDALVGSFKDTKPYLKPYLKLGHGEDQSLIRADELPNVGKVTAIYRIGDKLVADFERMPKKIFDLVAAGAYDRLSCEIYADAKINGKSHKLALKAIGILGGETPAVENLDDIKALYVNDGSVLAYEKENKLRVVLLDRSPKEGNMPMECAEELKSARKELDDLKGKHMALEVEAKKFSDEAIALKVQAGELSKENEALKSGKADLEKKFAAANAALEKVEGEKRQAKAETKVAELINSKKLLPAQKEAFTALLLNAMASGVRKYRLGDKEVEKPEADILLEFIEKGGAGLPTEESTEAGKSSKVNDLHSTEFAREVQKYADEHKVSFRDAHTALVAKRAEKK